VTGANLITHDEKELVGDILLLQKNYTMWIRLHAFKRLCWWSTLLCSRCQV